MGCCLEKKENDSDLILFGNENNSMIATKRTRPSVKELNQRKTLIITSKDKSYRATVQPKMRFLSDEDDNDIVDINPFVNRRLASRHEYSTKNMNYYQMTMGKNNLIPVDMDERCNKSDDEEIKKRKSIRLSKYLHVFQDNDPSNNKLTKSKNKGKYNKARKNNKDIHLGNYDLASFIMKESIEINKKQ